MFLIYIDFPENVSHVNREKIVLYFVCNFNDSCSTFWKILSLVAKLLMAFESPMQQTCVGLRLGL